jgi:hypothetical protein
MSVLFVIVIIEDSFAQEYLRTVGRYQYAMFEGEWYTVTDGKQGDLVDTKHIIVRLKDNEDINTFNFKDISLPQFKDVRG